MKRKVSHVFLIISVILVFSISLVSANGDKETAGPVEEKTVANIAVNRDITSLDSTGGGFTSTTASQHIYDSLIRLNEDMEPTPSLALEWNMVDDLTWEFKLRQGVKFHDGSFFNADSVVFSIKHYTDAIKYKYLAQWGLAWPPTAEALDEFTVRIKTPTPQPAVPRLLSRLAMIPVNYGGKSLEEFFAAPIGTGAYKFSDWNHGICLTLTANEDYWRVTPAIKTLNYYTVSDDNARLAGFKSGEYDIVYGVPYDQVDSIGKLEGKTVMQKPTIGYDAIQFNFRWAPGDPVANVKVREAMKYAIDHAGICLAIMDGFQEPARGPAPLNVFGAYDGGGYPARDLAKVKQLLDEAGYKGEEIKFVYHTGEFTSDLEISELVLAQLQEAGFNVSFNQVESGAWTDMKRTPTWDITNNSVPGSFSGEAQYHYNQMKSLTGLQLDDFESILNAADADTQQSSEERAQDISDAMKVLWDYVPYVFGSVPTSSIGMDDRLVGYEYIPLNWLILAEAKFSN